jgi:hypothetical protein
MQMHYVTLNLTQAKWVECVFQALEGVGRDIECVEPYQEVNKPSLHLYSKYCNSRVLLDVSSQVPNLDISLYPIIELFSNGSSLF